MKYFYLITNTEKEKAIEVSSFIKCYLEERGAVCEGAARSKAAPGMGYKYTDTSLVPLRTECVITLGGDGTLIQAARDLAGRNIPLIGVNLGTLGYLTQFGKEEEVSSMLDGLLHDNYRLEKRMMLDGSAYHDGKDHYHGIALNEIVITRIDALKVLKFSIYVNDKFLNDYAADGMIIATPTGSTAYNLSAGGPIVAPDASVIMLTPICPHTLNSRSIVLSAADNIRIEAEGSRGQRQEAVFDGDTAIELMQGDYIQISRSQIETTLVKLKDVSFLDNLRNKMAGI